MVKPAPIPQLAEDSLGKRAVASSILARSSKVNTVLFKRAGIIQWPHRRTRDGGDAFSNRTT